MFGQSRNWIERRDGSVSQKGFTLIELLVVIAILGVLAVVGVLSFGGLTNKAQAATAKTEEIEVQTAIDAYNSTTKAYPIAATGSLGGPGVAAAGSGLLAMEPAQLKLGTKFQCAYDLDVGTGTVSFSAAGSQTDANCQ